MIPINDLLYYLFDFAIKSHWPIGINEWWHIQGRWWVSFIPGFLMYLCPEPKRTWSAACFTLCWGLVRYAESCLMFIMASPNAVRYGRYMLAFFFAIIISHFTLDQEGKVAMLTAHSETMAAMLRDIGLAMFSFDTQANVIFTVLVGKFAILMDAYYSIDDSKKFYRKYECTLFEKWLVKKDWRLD